MSQITSSAPEISSAPSQPKVISAEQFRQLRESDPNISIVDVRTPAEFGEVHLEGARLIPLDKLDGKGLASDHAKGSLYLMCGSGKRATQAAKQLCAAGHGDVIVVEGGMQGCEAAGIEVNRGRKVMSLERQVRIAAGFLVFLGAVLSMVNPWFVLLSGFVGAGLMFAGITDTCGMGMLIAKMPWNQRAH